MLRDVGRYLNIREKNYENMAVMLILKKCCIFLIILVCGTQHGKQLLNFIPINLSSYPVCVTDTIRKLHKFLIEK